MEDKEGLVILGSTGSIGTQTLEVAQALQRPVAVLTAFDNIALLARQIELFQPALAVVGSEKKAMELKQRLQEHQSYRPEIAWGKEGFAHAAAWPGATTVVAAMVGMAGLEPVLEAAKAGKTIALANKETLVAAGELVNKAVKAHGSRLLPVDSEHSALFQCLGGETRTDVSKLYLTASGGPFRTWPVEALEKVTPARALKHPNWSMGAKVTIDSATLMNKGLEVIEAFWLFGIPLEQIEVLVHPQSIIHSMVEYLDGSILAQLGTADMRTPIQVALTWPEHKSNPFPRLNFMEQKTLTFEAPRREDFPCLDLAYAAQREGGTMPALVNGANEKAVADFLAGKIAFTEIPRRIEKAMARHRRISHPDLEAIQEADREGRQIDE